MIMKLMIHCPECAAGYYGATTTDVAATCTKCPGTHGAARVIIQLRAIVTVSLNLP